MNKKHLIVIFLLMIVVLFLILNKLTIENFNSDSNSNSNNKDNEEIYYDESGNISGIKTKYMGITFKLSYIN